MVEFIVPDKIWKTERGKEIENQANKIIDSIKEYQKKNLFEQNPHIKSYICEC